MVDSCIVLIAAAHALPALTERFTGSRLLTFTEGDALRALQAVVSQRPSLVVLERMFAATPRGTALIARIKADATVDGTEIRVVSYDGSYARTIRRGRSEAADGPSIQAPPSKLDSTGTRRVARHRMKGGVDAKVDGIAVVLIDLSTLGAQVISPAVMRPNQRVQVALADAVASLACRATVAWANFERSQKKADPSYRAGLEFLTADHAAVDNFCKRNAV